MMCILFPFLLPNVEDLLHEHGTAIRNKTMRFSCSRFGSMFAADIRKYPVSREPSSDWRWQFDAVFVRINGRETQKVDLPRPEREWQLWAGSDIVKGLFELAQTVHGGSRKLRRLRVPATKSIKHIN